MTFPAWRFLCSLNMKENYGLLVSKKDDFEINGPGRLFVESELCASQSLIQATHIFLDIFNRKRFNMGVKKHAKSFERVGVSGIRKPDLEIRKLLPSSVSQHPQIR